MGVWGCVVIGGEALFLFFFLFFFFFFVSFFCLFETQQNHKKKNEACVVIVVGSTINLEALKERVHGEIRDHLRETYGEAGDENKDHCSKYPCCFLNNATDGCSISNMPSEPSTLVFPGGKTRCIFSSSSDFACQVWPGATDKLVIYFQGGGACWDKSSTTSSLCTTSIAPGSTHGIFDRENSDNKFSEYTIVHILYCSGDLHVGNVTRPYTDRHGVPVQQRGQANTVSVYQWIKQQQEKGELASKLTDLVMMGQSAGSIGVQSWSGEILRFLEYENAAVIPDSYIGVFPPNSQGPLIYNYGCCGVANISGLDIPSFYIQECFDQKLTLQDVVEYWLQQYPNVNFNYLQSKADSVQISFYIALALSVGGNPVLTEGQFYKQSNAIMEIYNKYPNFVTYLIDGTQHTFTPLNLYYTAGPTGPREGGDADFMLDQWVPLNPLTPGQKISTSCDGKVQGEDMEEGEKARSLGPTYCDTNLVPKTYTQD